MSESKKVRIGIELVKLSVLTIALRAMFEHAIYAEAGWDIFFNLAQAGLVILAYFAGRHFADTYPDEWRNYLLVVYGVGILTLFSWAGYGTHTEDGDPIYGGGETIVDFVPTDVERSNLAFTIFVKYSIAALFGVYKKHHPY